MRKIIKDYPHNHPNTHMLVVGIWDSVSSYPHHDPYMLVLVIWNSVCYCSLYDQ